MQTKDYNDNLDDLRAGRRRDQYVHIGFILIVLVMLYLLVTTWGSAQTIISAPDDAGYWVSRNAASQEYLERMGKWVAFQELTMTPAGADANEEELLKLVHPKYYGKCKEKMDLSIAKLKRDNAATVFSVQQVQTQPKFLAALIRGRLVTYINSSRVNDEDTIFFVQFEMSGGRAQLVEAHEVPHADLAQILKENFREKLGETSVATVKDGIDRTHNARK
jgi:type IV conjugative transfer system protein TraE